jgi:hypothetical protein
MKKLSYSKKELIDSGWNMIGGQIEDYIEIWKRSGREAAFDQIKRDYKELTAAVYRGLIVAYQFGIKFYYGIRKLEMSSERKRR